MYADFSSDRVKAFFQELTDQPVRSDETSMAEAFSDEMILAEMELSRMKQAIATNSTYTSRNEKLLATRRIHPADFQ